MGPLEAAATEGAVLLGGSDLVSALVRRVSGQQARLGAVLAACALLLILCTASVERVGVRECELGDGRASLTAGQRWHELGRRPHVRLVPLCG